MLDISSLTLIVTLLFSLLVGQSAFNGDTMHLRISVSSDIAKSGLDESVAEDIFTATAADLTSGESLIAVPRIRVSTQPGLATTMAKRLSLGDIVHVTQTTLGIETMTVVAALMQGPDADAAKANVGAGGAQVANPVAKTCLNLVLVATHPAQGIEQHRISQCDIQDPVALLKQGAAWTMERVAPYRVVLSEVLKVARGKGGDLPHAKATAERVLARPGRLENASEQAMINNLLAMIALAEKDSVAADRWLSEVQAVPELPPRIVHQLLLNQTMVATVRKQPAEARRLLAKAMEARQDIDLPDFAANFLIMQALTAWSGGDTAAAETLLRQAVQVSARNEAAHVYLSKLAALKGDTDGAAREAHTASIVRRFDPTLQSLAVTLFWIDPVNGTGNGGNKQPTAGMRSALRSIATCVRSRGLTPCNGPLNHRMPGRSAVA